MKSILLFLTNYLIGSIPFAYIITKLKTGQDIRTLGSGNVGGTNVARVLGRRFGWLVIGLDAAKGLLAVALSFALMGEVSEYVPMLIASGALLGHLFPIFLGFKGGKGVAVSLGLLIGSALFIKAMPMVLGICLLVWFAAYKLTGYVAVASIGAAAVFGITALLLFDDIGIKILSFILAALVIWMHRSNIKRLLRNEENKSNL